MKNSSLRQYTVALGFIGICGIWVGGEFTTPTFAVKNARILNPPLSKPLIAVLKGLKNVRCPYSVLRRNLGQFEKSESSTQQVVLVPVVDKAQVHDWLIRPIRQVNISYVPGEASWGTFFVKTIADVSSFRFCVSMMQFLFGPDSSFLSYSTILLLGSFSFIFLGPVDLHSLEESQGGIALSVARDFAAASFFASLMKNRSQGKSASEQIQILLEEKAKVENAPRDFIVFVQSQVFTTVSDSLSGSLGMSLIGRYRHSGMCRYLDICREEDNQVESPFALELDSNETQFASASSAEGNEGSSVSQEALISLSSCDPQYREDPMGVQQWGVPGKVSCWLYEIGLTQDIPP